MNVENQYADELTEIESDPRYLRLCTLQVKELSAITARHAQDRVLLALGIRKEMEDVWPDPNSNGWVDAWNGWYATYEEAKDAASGVTRPRVLTHGEGLVSEDEMERRLASE